ncbi:MAG: hypothetical protein QF718_01465 [Phycisphaerales bacterium]|jgi:hypothetical protein|nr:hypothetical protein [Phycisphaerales bacterium]
MIQRLVICVLIVLLIPSVSKADSREKVLEKLNNSSSTEGTEDVKSWRVFFDACIEITEPPQELSDSFNMNTVWPNMSNWSEVSDWAAQNEQMEKAFIESASRALIGIPYGGENVPDTYREHGIVAEIGVDGRLHELHFGYIETVKLACLWATAESYRLFEIGASDRAIRLMMSELIVLRKFCDREFLKEQLTFMPMLGDALSNTRDLFYRYRESIKPTQYRTIAMEGISYLRTDSTRLLVPEGDRVVGEAIVTSLFDPNNGMPDPAKFSDILTDIQADQELLTRFGAAKYWSSIASIHRGRDDSIRRLNLIYDDWWRRWKMRSFHPQLSVDTEWQKSNPVKYAAVNLVIRDIQELFRQRDLLTVQINGTAVSAALCGYKNHYGVYPASIKMMYAQLLHRSNNLDPLKSLPLQNQEDWTLYDAAVGPFQYRKIDKETRIATLLGNVFVKQGQCLLYSVSSDDEDNRGTNSRTDIILWPPLKTLQREVGLLD